MTHQRRPAAPTHLQNSRPRETLLTAGTYVPAGCGHGCVNENISCKTPSGCQRVRATVHQPKAKTGHGIRGVLAHFRLCLSLECCGGLHLRLPHGCQDAKPSADGKAGYWSKTLRRRRRLEDSRIEGSSPAAHGGGGALEGSRERRHVEGGMGADTAATHAARSYEGESQQDSGGGGGGD